MSRPANIEKMSDYHYFRWMDIRRDRFWRGGHEFKASKHCGICEPNDESPRDEYVCISCEKDQLDEAGY